MIEKKNNTDKKEIINEECRKILELIWNKKNKKFVDLIHIKEKNLVIETK